MRIRPRNDGTSLWAFQPQAEPERLFLGSLTGADPAPISLEWGGTTTARDRTPISVRIYAGHNGKATAFGILELNGSDSESRSHVNAVATACQFSRLMFLGAEDRGLDPWWLFRAGDCRHCKRPLDVPGLIRLTCSNCVAECRHETRLGAVADHLGRLRAGHFCIHCGDGLATDTTRDPAACWLGLINDGLVGGPAYDPADPSTQLVMHTAWTPLADKGVQITYAVGGTPPGDYSPGALP